MADLDGALTGRSYDGRGLAKGDQLHPSRRRSSSTTRLVQVLDVEAARAAGAALFGGGSPGVNTPTATRVQSAYQVIPHGIKAIPDRMKVIHGYFYPIADHLKATLDRFYPIADHLKVIADGKEVSWVGFK